MCGRYAEKKCLDKNGNPLYRKLCAPCTDREAARRWAEKKFNKRVWT